MIFGQSRPKSAGGRQALGQAGPLQPLVYQNISTSGVPIYTETKPKHAVYATLVTPDSVPSAATARAGYVSDQVGHKPSNGGWLSSLSRSRSKNHGHDKSLSHQVIVESAPPLPPFYPHAGEYSRGRRLHKLHGDTGIEEEEPLHQREQPSRLHRSNSKDPYTPSHHRQGRSRSVDSERRREQVYAWFRDCSPETQARVLYNSAHRLRHPEEEEVKEERPSVQIEIHSAHPDTRRTSGYHTDDIQISTLRRRSSSGGAIATTSIRHTRPSEDPAPPKTAKLSSKGFYNRRGDQFLGEDTIIRQPMELEYAPEFANYPEVGKGFANAYGTVINTHGNIVSRSG